ncbi:DUF4157 domain-containing protein [Desulfococcus sp.]|uniref:eCIS core domain-containing protein n=1 Tax=Desulfococcus sp. TaxID=2025834 RepID=UPI00359431F7
MENQRMDALQRSDKAPRKIKISSNNHFPSHANTYRDRNFSGLRGRSSMDEILSTTDTVLSLQKTVGNHAVAEMIQTKLKIHPPGDKYEREADRIADQVMRGGEPLTFQNTPLTRKQDQPDEIGNQTAKNSDGTPSIAPDMESKINSLRGHGKPFDKTARNFYEKRFGQDFGDVRIHDDIQAAELNKNLNARAFTYGNHIALGAGEFTRNSESGNRLMAHELTHVIQQRRPPCETITPSLMRQEKNLSVQRQSQCPTGSCHVHVEYYRSVFGDKEEEEAAEPYPAPGIQERLWNSPREREILLEWLQSGVQEQESPNRLSGQHIRSDVAREYQKHRAEFESKPNRNVKVIRFEVPENENDPDWSKLKASEVSANQKQLTFKELSLLPEIKIFHRTVDRKTFVDYIEAQNADDSVFGIIVQLPVPAHLQGDVKRISPKKDLDALSLEKERKFSVPATSEGVVRVVLPFVQSGQTVAVIGGKGFVGSGVIKLLKEKGVVVGVFDEGDDLKQVKAYDIVVSAVGKPRIVKSAYLKPEHILVVDTGFIPETEAGGKLKVIGDVEEAAQEIPRHITPVPGGTGPVEMAALMERAARLLGIKVKTWRVELRDGKLRAVFSE